MSRIALPCRVAVLAVVLGMIVIAPIPVLAAGSQQVAPAAAGAAAPRGQTDAIAALMRSVQWLQWLQMTLGKAAGSPPGTGRLVVDAGICIDPNGQCNPH
jgi:hypothetical protein